MTSKEWRHHSGTGNLVYAGDMDYVGQCWCTDCQKWIRPDKWNEACSSTKERRVRDRRAAEKAQGDSALREALELWISGITKENRYGGWFLRVIILSILQDPSGYIAEHAILQDAGQESGENPYLLQGDELDRAEKMRKDGKP